MSNLITEESMLNQLDIPDWRHMTKDKIISFASSMQYMNPEVAKKAIEQFPKFSEMSSGIVSVLKESLTEINESNTKSTDKTYEINIKILDSLEKQLNKKFLLPKEREKIIDSMLEVSNNISNIDKSNKTFLIQGLKTVCGSALAIVTVGAAILGVKFRKDV